MRGTVVLLMAVELQNQPSVKRSDADPSIFLPRVVALVLVFQRATDELGRRIEALVTLLGEAFWKCGYIYKVRVQRSTGEEVVSVNIYIEKVRVKRDSRQRNLEESVCI